MFMRIMACMAAAILAATAWIGLPKLVGDGDSAVIFTANRQWAGEVPISETRLHRFYAGPGAEVVIATTSTLAAVGSTPPPKREKQARAVGQTSYTIGNGTYAVTTGNRTYRFTNE